MNHSLSAQLSFFDLPAPRPALPPVPVMSPLPRVEVDLETVTRPSQAPAPLALLPWRCWTTLHADGLRGEWALVMGAGIHVTHKQVLSREWRP